MKSLLKNKILTSLAIYNLISFLYFFIIFIMQYVELFEMVNFAQVLSLLIYMAMTLFTFLLVNTFLIFFSNREPNSSKAPSKKIIFIMVVFVSVLLLYLIFSIPITVYNQVEYYKIFQQINITNLINSILQSINCIILIIYTTYLLKKEYSSIKSSNPTSPD